VTADGHDRNAQKLETLAYLCCLEALQNVATTPPQPQRSRSACIAPGELRFEITDHGRGLVATSQH